ncbi:MAG: glycine zipper 2TM domain-containing protein [Steroidobacteraceae bacterium]
MNRSMLVGAVIGAAAVTAGGAIAGYSAWERSHNAEVLSAEPLTKLVKTPRQECRDVTVTHQQEPRDKKRVTGTVVGAVVGGVLGNQVGGGTGKTIATVAGAAAGGYAGNRVQQRVQEGNTYETTEQQCKTVYESHREPDGFKVTYQLDGATGTVRMARDPGKFIPVKDGKLVLDEA